MTDLDDARPSAVAVDMVPELLISVRSVMWVVWASIALLLALHLGAEAAASNGVIAPDGRTATAFDMDVESSLPTWFSIVLLASIGAGQLVIFAILRFRGEPRSGGWLVLGLAFLVVSADEGAGLHERLTVVVRELLGVSSGPLYYAWVVPYVLALVATAPLLIGFVLRLPRRVAALAALGGVLYVGGAVGVELISGTLAAEAVAAGASHVGSWALVALEETLELCGAATFGYALLLYYRDHVQSPAHGVRLVMH